MSTGPQVPPPPGQPQFGQQPGFGGSWKPPIDSSRIRPSLWWLAVPVVLVVAGLALAAVLFATTLSDVSEITGDLDRFSAPGSTTLKLDADAERTIYVRVGSTGGPDNTSSPRVLIDSLSLRCVARGATTGERVTATRYDGGTFTLTKDNDRYDAALELSIHKTDTYRITCSTDSSSRLQLAIGPKIGIFGLVAGVFGIFAAAGGGFVLALFAVLLIFLLRYFSKRKLRREAAAAAGYQIP